ncbi:MAG TPA: MG2 domain-containing protein [Kofleriaceae bacterium]|nr:MG2 domain-containing protein [Kofleriaceae bacterium]
MKTRLLIAAAVLLAAGACGRSSSKSSSGSSGTSSLAKAAAAAAAAAAGADEQTDAAGDAPPKREALTPKSLSVVIHALAAADSVPTAVVFDVGVPIVDRYAVGSGTGQSAVKITPEVRGTLTYSSVSGLRFTPDVAFAFDTAYEIELAKLETRDGVLEPPAGTRWQYSFKTPPFKLLGGAPTEVDLKAKSVTMELSFSGPVLPNLAFAAMDVLLDGKKPARANLARSTPLTSTVSIQVTDPALTVGSKLAIIIARDLPTPAGGKLAKGGRVNYVVASEETLSIKAADIVESANGFFVEIVCDDSAAPEGTRSAYMASQSWDGLSQRCQLSDTALAKLRFDPPVKKVYVTDGRAGFRVFGDFKRGTYAMKIEPGATSVDGAVLLAPFSSSFVVPARKPQLSFGSSGRYLPRSAWNNLPIKHQNVDAVNLFVRQIPAENLVFWLGGPDAADARTSDLILQKEIPLRGTTDTLSTTWLDVAQHLPATTKGVLEMKLVGQGVRATSRLMLTDMSLVAKKTVTPGKPWEQQVQVWALGMDSQALLDGVDVTLVRRSGKTVARCTTAGARGCLLSTTGSSDPDRGEPFAVIARRGDDLTYIRYEDLRATVAESSTSGLPYTSDAPYHAAMFADRGVYRPGDTTHVVAIVRDAQERAPEKPLPIEVKLLDPRAKVARKLTLSTNASGVIAFAHELPAFADTGHWRVELSVGDKPLSAYSVQVEEFVPERMKVSVAAKTPDARIGAKMAFDVSAQYLFGGSAADAGVQLNCSVEPSRFVPDENADLTYGVEPKGRAVPLGEATEQLDQNGKVSIECADAPAGATFTQTAELTATAAVLEAGSGRATVRTATATLHPEAFYIGLRSKATRAAAGEAFTVEGMLVDWKGHPAPQVASKVAIELVHLEADYGYGYDEYSGESHYDRNVRQVPEGKLEATVTGGKFSFSVTPAEAEAGYVVRVKVGKARTELVLDGTYPYSYYGYGGDSSDRTPRPTRPTQLLVSVPKQVKVGEEVAVSVKTPYRGKVLWTVETDRVVQTEWRDATGAEAQWKFKLAQFAPNVYVSAFLVKDPHQESKDAFLPDRAFGISSARVLPEEFTQDVKLETPKEIRSSSQLSVTLDVGRSAGPTVAMVAVVDEGILSLTDFPTPDPLAQIFAKRALGVETYETIGWTMLHQPAGASSRTGGGDDGSGGDDGALGNTRVQPVKPVALFSGVVPVGADGKLTIPFQIPQYRGQVRVMAITASATRIGRAESKVLVRDPLVVQTTFPRFVTQNDQLEIPVFLTNVSGGPLEVSLALASEALALPGIAAPKNAPAPITFTGKSSGAVKLEDGRADTIVFQARATMPIGGAKLRVTATAKGRAGTFTVNDEVEVPFLPAGPKERAISKVRLAAGKVDLAGQPALRNWVPTSETTRFWLTANPYGESFDHLKYLIRYPFGCVEQTTSSTRPLLYIAELAEQIDPELSQKRVEDMVLAGVNRLLSMETPSGGLGYWPGATEPEEWATAYATHMLIDAKRAGYAVPDDRLTGILNWIDARVTLRERNGRVHANRWGHYDEQAEAYLHYVLALAGKGKKARIATLIGTIPANAKGELAEGLYMLKAALYHAGDRRYERDLKAVDTSPIVEDRSNGWSFYSDRRRRGFMLSTFFDLFGNDTAGEALAQRVASDLTGHVASYYNTQELVWGVTGLGKWVRAIVAKGAAGGGTLTADGTAITPRAGRPQAKDRTWTVARASEYKSLVLDVPAAADGMWLVVSSEGVRPGADYQVGGKGLAVTREYKKLDGTEVDLSDGSLKLGELVFVEVTVENTSDGPIQNLALVDRLPAGFEIENPRLGRSSKASWITAEEQWEPDFLNMRDDRLQAFGTLPARTSKKVTYTVRAVTSGTFTVPPVELEAMYDPALWARAKGGTAVIGGPWTGKTI